MGRQKQTWSTSTLSEIGRTADVISLHIPLFPETQHIINALTIAEFKRGVFLINVNRGALWTPGL